MLLQPVVGVVGDVAHFIISLWEAQRGGVCGFLFFLCFDLVVIEGTAFTRIILIYGRNCKYIHIINHMFPNIPRKYMCFFI